MQKVIRQYDIYDNTINMENLEHYLILVAHFIDKGRVVQSWVKITEG